MRLVNDILLQLAMLDAGIIPFALKGRIIDEKSLRLIDQRIASMPIENQRLVKRKFRKLWKKAVRKLNHERVRQNMSEVDVHQYGRPSKKPSSYQKRMRRGVVLWYLKSQFGNQNSDK
jgi:hypothetical protein